MARLFFIGLLSYYSISFCTEVSLHRFLSCRGSLGSSAVLGIIPNNHLSANQLNNLSTAFYIGYIVFVGPHVWLMQRFPIAKYISLNIGLWSILLGLQAVIPEGYLLAGL